MKEDMKARSHKFRILHAPITSANQPCMQVDALRRMGHTADFISWNFEPIHKLLITGCDVELQLYDDPSATHTKLFDFVRHALRNYDIIHFHSIGTLVTGDLLPKFSDLAWLKRQGKKIVMHWWGTDRRLRSLTSRRKYSPCPQCSPARVKSCTRPGRLGEIAKVEKYADVILSNGDLCIDFPQIRWFNNAIDTDMWCPLPYHDIPARFRLPPTDSLRIYHSVINSATRSGIKGTDVIVDAVQKLRAEGYALEFIFFDKMPNKDLRYYQMQADVAIEDLRYGWYGSTSMECMACGTPTICYLREDIQAIAPVRPPILNATVDSIYGVLKQVCDDAQLRQDLSRRSRAYALKYHALPVVGAELENIYTGLFQTSSPRSGGLGVLP